MKRNAWLACWGRILRKKVLLKPFRFDTSIKKTVSEIAKLYGCTVDELLKEE